VRGLAVQQQWTSPIAERAFTVAPEQSGGTSLRLMGKEECGDAEVSNREEAAEKWLPFNSKSSWLYLGAILAP
jgi:hypothetical protein